MAIDNREAIEQALQLYELDQRVRQGDIPLPQEKPLEAALEHLKRYGRVLTKEGKLDGRVAAGKRRRKKNTTRKRNNARQQRWRKKWNERMLTEALTQDNYYKYVSGRWKRKKRQWVITEEEWLTYVQPTIPVGCIIELRRYDTGKPTDLGNIIVYNASNGDVLFDGKEHLLSSLGYCLQS